MQQAIVALIRSTFYLHYKDKFDLLCHTVQKVMDELRSSVTGVPLAYSPEEPHPGMIQLLEHVARHAAFYSVMLGEQGVKRFDYSMMKIMRESYADMLDSLRPEAKNGRCLSSTSSTTSPPRILA
ncbi:MAG: TetR-like C-terminal domain-containing protein [Tumebacillaceae bacterium]